jgi:hypothetical protein
MSVFSFLRSDEPEKPEGESPLEVEAAAALSPGTAPAIAAAAAAGVSAALAAAPSTFSATGGGTLPPIDVQPFLDDLLTFLDTFLPDDAGGMPSNSLVLIELNHRSLGVGGLRGVQTLSGLEMGELRGGWLEGTLRFDFWAADPAALQTAAASVQSAILSASPALRAQRVLQFRYKGSAESRTEDPERWRRGLDYTFLYEYHYVDVNGAAGLIARIPIHSHTDMTEDAEISEVRDWMVLWDEGGAPALEIAPGAGQRLTISRLAAAAFLPEGGPDGEVTQVVVQSGETATTEFDSLAAFLDSFDLAGATLDLVYPPLPLEPDETAGIHAFQVGEHLFDPALVLVEGDRFELRFSEDAFPANNLSQVYLRAFR